MSAPVRRVAAQPRRLCNEESRAIDRVVPPRLLAELIAAKGEIVRLQGELRAALEMVDAAEMARTVEDQIG